MAPFCVYTWEDQRLDAVRRARSGDIDAFEELVDTYTPSVYRLARSWVGDAAAADVTQDVFLAAWRRLPQLRDPDSFRPWLLRIALNRCRSLMRGRRPDLALQVDRPGAPEAPDLRPAAEARALVSAAFVQLSADQRTLISLHYAAGLTIREVAETLEIPDGTVKSRLHAALTVLRASIQGPGS